MNINNLVLKHKLNGQENLNFYDHIKNRFIGLKKYEPENLDYIHVWENFVMLFDIINAAEIINKKIYPRYLIDFNKPK